MASSSSATLLCAPHARWMKGRRGGGEISYQHLSVCVCNKGLESGHSPSFYGPLPTAGGLVIKICPSPLRTG